MQSIITENHSNIVLNLFLLLIELILLSTSAIIEHRNVPKYQLDDPKVPKQDRETTTCEVSTENSIKQDLKN